jgi:hypothetical protein
MSGDVIKSVAAHAPTTLEELSSMGVLGESKVKEYGKRLVVQIVQFINDNNLKEYIDRRPLKRPKTAESASQSSSASNKPSRVKSKAPQIFDIDDDDDDEFGDIDIDFGAIDVP